MRVLPSQIELIVLLKQKREIEHSVDIIWCGLHAVRRQSIAASRRPCASNRSERLYQASTNVGLARVAARNAASASTLRPAARSMFPRLNGGAASVGSHFIKTR